MRFIELNNREYKELLNNTDLAQLYRDGLSVIFEVLIGYSILQVDAPDGPYDSELWRKGVLVSIEEADPIGSVYGNINKNYRLANEILSIPSSDIRQQEAQRFVDQVLVQYLDFSRCLPKDTV